jgi:hypothetical protein
MCAWAYGSIYGWRPEIVLYLSLLAWSLRCYTGHTIAVSPLYSPLAIESLLDSLLGSLLERAALDKTPLWEE